MSQSRVSHNLVRWLVDGCAFKVEVLDREWKLAIFRQVGSNFRSRAQLQPGGRVVVNVRHHTPAILAGHSTSDHHLPPETMFKWLQVSRIEFHIPSTFLFRLPK